jgi:hypothetical protein
LDLGNTLLTATLAEQNPRCRSMGKDMTPNRLAAIGTSKESARSRVALDLVGQKYGDIKLCVLLAEIEAGQWS